jgi:hypothetical protein
MIADAMARTTLDLDQEVLDSLKRLQTREHKPLGRLASDLIAEALARRGAAKKPRPKGTFQWNSGPLHALVDLTDKDAVYKKLDGAS